MIRTDAGTPIAVVIADAALARYRGLFDAAVRTSGLALRNAQLQAEAARAELDSVARRGPGLWPLRWPNGAGST